MRFVIVGFGRVGMRTARILDKEGHDVTVIDDDAKKAERAREGQFDVIEGDGADDDVIERADLPNADAVGGLTGDLNVNFSACVVAKHYDCRAVLRIDEDYREEIYQKYADEVDEIVYPERLGAIGAKNALLGGNFNVIADLTEQLSLSSLTVAEGAPAVDRRVSELDLPEGVRVYAHGRSDEPMTIPLPQTVIEAGDQFALVAESDALPAVKTELQGEDAEPA